MPQRTIVDLLCEKFGFSGYGRFAKLAARMGVSPQVINNWRMRNSLPKDHYETALEAGLTTRDLATVRRLRKVEVSFLEFCANITKYIEQVRAGDTVTLSFDDGPEVQILPVKVRAGSRSKSAPRQRQT